MASEKEAALSAVPSPTTIFDKIIEKEIPAKIVYEDDQVLAFRDIQPQAPTHIVIIPKTKYGLTGLSATEEKHCDIFGCLRYTAKLVAKQEGLNDGFRIVINDGPIEWMSVCLPYPRASPWRTSDELASWLRSISFNNCMS